MVFSSPIFLFLFLPVVLAIYGLLPGIQARNRWLLAASVIFYAWGQFDFIGILLISVLANFFIASFLERQTNPLRRKQLLALGVAGNVGLLAMFKYLSPVFIWLTDALGLDALPPDFLTLPLGISFFTFHALSYLMDVYRQKQRAAAKPADLALYIMFFPQMIAGPILRWQAIAPQLADRRHSREKFAEGVRRFVIGLAKKVLVANMIAWPVDQIFALPAAQLSAADAWLGIVGYTLQIYFDFSGYSDMAVGMGKMFGFEFMENFQYPYIAQSIRDFWHRWHISLSTWFRDYLYFPLGGNRISPSRTIMNLLVVFFLCGLWHGASKKFVIWGLFHGLFLALERTSFGSFVEKLPRPLRHGYALVVVMFGWVFFRADDFQASLAYLAAMVGWGQATEPQPLWRYATHLVLWIIVVGSIGSTPWWAAVRARLIKTPAEWPVLQAVFPVAKTIGIVLLFFLSLSWLAGETYNPFIYFRF